MRERLHFEELKEHRGTYIVGYAPPFGDAKFSTLSITFLSLPTPPIREVVEGEIRLWLDRYPVPIMAFAWDSTEEILSEENSYSCVGWLDAVTNKAVLSWDYQDLTAITDKWHAPEDWRSIFADVPVRTGSQMSERGSKQTRERRRQVLWWKILLAIWAVGIPVGLALLEFFGPQWLAVFTLFVALASAWGAFRRLWGLEKVSKREERDAEKKRKMDHYFYHCERNPTGFAALKAENFAKDAEERVRGEAADLLLRKSISTHN